MAAPMTVMVGQPVRHFSTQFLRQIKSFGKINYSRTCAYATIERISSGVPGIVNISICQFPKTVGYSSVSSTSHRHFSYKLDQSGLSPTKGKQQHTHCFPRYSGLAAKRSLCRNKGGRTYSLTAESNVDIDNSGNTTLILGIETSCDDTGAAVVDQSGRVVGEALNSQTKIHVELGGIIPYVARDLHRQNIEGVVQDALRDAGVSLKDLDAIACTVKPGLLPSLEVGIKYAKKLVHESGKPFIPIHHMEAHALTARMNEPIDFPFLVLLASGGHCLLAVARDIDDFLLLGTTLDEAPGDGFDKIARKLKLKNLAECAGLCGGAAVEKMARGGDPKAFPLTSVMLHRSSCDFSFSGIKAAALEIIRSEEEKHDVSVVDVLPTVADVCATFQYHTLHHLAKRVQRALLYCEMTQLLPYTNKTMVLSGGVGSNLFLREGLQRMCAEYDCTVVCPPPNLCTDNGIMIAWNGMEKWKVGRGIVSDLDTVHMERKSPFGQDIRKEVENSSIKLKGIKLI